MNKINNKLSAGEKFQVEFARMLDMYYRQRISDNIKRGIRAKKMSSLVKKLSTKQINNCNAK